MKQPIKASWKPSIDLERFNFLVVQLEQKLLAFLHRECPLEELYHFEALQEIYHLVDEDPWQAFLYARIKNAHAMTPRHGINVMLTARVWIRLFHKFGSKVDDFSFSALVHDAGHWYSGNLVYVMNRYTFEQADQLPGHCLELQWGEGILTDEMKGWIRDHHENQDGSGYPNRCVNPSLPAQILRIADCFEGLTTKRHFRPAHSYAKALALMIRWTPYKFNPGLMKSFREFLGTYPPGTTLILKSNEIAIVLPPAPGEKDFNQLIITNKQGDFREGLVEPLVIEDIKSETVPYFQPRLEEKWKPIRPDLMGLRRNYLEEDLVLTEAFHRDDSSDN
ncbi:MAG: hypothetical protein CSA81_12655 [Acidobacteria bacterium]|nr:MAG: hypothetical protein CSA81_12655 [Acidobacteriota bacterium]